MINEKQQKEFDSILKVGDTNFELKQLSVDAYSCPVGKDSNGNNIPECDEYSYYVPIRFIFQGLAYNVEWNENNPKRIDITTDLQNRLKEQFGLKFVLSETKVNINEKVENGIDIKDFTLKKDKKYYLYAVDSDNVRKFNSAIAQFDNTKNVKITNEKEDNENTFSFIEATGDVSGDIAFITTVTIPNEDNNYKAGIYPIIDGMKLNAND